MNIRTNMTQKEVVANMLELSVYLAQMDDDCNTIDIEVNGLNMHFEAWSEEKKGD